MLDAVDAAPDEPSSTTRDVYRGAVADGAETPDRLDMLVAAGVCAIAVVVAAPCTPVLGSPPAVPVPSGYADEPEAEEAARSELFTSHSPVSALNTSKSPATVDATTLRPGSHAWCRKRRRAVHRAAADPDVRVSHQVGCARVDIPTAAAASHGAVSPPAADEAPADVAVETAVPGRVSAVGDSWAPDGPTREPSAAWGDMRTVVLGTRPAAVAGSGAAEATSIAAAKP